MPRHIDRFEIVKPLGRGSQGVVYLARDPRLDRQVAIKTLIPSKSAQQHQAQLLAEARIVGRLQHPNIIPIFEAGEYENGLYLVFEYVEGTTLAALLARSGGLAIHQAINFINPVLDGMAYAHGEGVVHGDLKPGNILIGRNRVPRVMDFGIARIMGEKGGKREGVWGSLNYLSPEHVSGKEPNARSDIFALGLIFWEMLCGRQAISGDNQLTLMHQIANVDVPPVSRYNKNADPRLDAFVRKALERDPELRYADAADMRADLEAYLRKDEEPNDELDPNQSTLAFLLRRMRHKPDFPAISQHITEINRLAASNTESSANELSNAVLKEFSLTNKLLKLVNSALYGQYGGRISTVTRAVVILGFDQVRMAALSLMLFEHLHNKGQVVELKDQLLGSLIASVMAKGMAPRQGIKDGETAFICTLFHHLGKMLVIYYFAEEFEQIGQVQDQKGLSEKEATRSVLGLSYEELGRGVAKEWNFPPQMVDSMVHLPPGETDIPRTENERLRCISNFTNELTTIAATTTQAEKKEALAAITARFERSLGVTSSQVDGLLTQALEHVEQYTEILNIDTSQSHLVKNIGEWANPSKKKAGEGEGVAAGEAGEGRKPAATTSAEDHQMVLFSGIQEITNALLSDYNVNDIMMMILETMYRGLGLSRVLVCISNAKRDGLAARFGFGTEVDAAIKAFQFRLKETQNIFAETVASQQDLVVNDTQEVRDKLPEWYFETFDAPAFAVYPVIINRVVVGIFYVDKDEPGPFPQNHLNYLKTLRNQAVLAIRQKSG